MRRTLMVMASQTALSLATHAACGRRAAASRPRARGGSVTPECSSARRVSEKSGVPMPNCTAAAEEVARKHASLGSRIQVDLDTVNSPTFGRFYYTNSFYGKGHKQAFQLEPGTKILLTILLGFLGLALFEAKAYGATCCGEGDGAGESNRREGRDGGKADDGNVDGGKPGGEPGAAAVQTRASDGGGRRSWLQLLKLHVALLATAVVYVDILSGLLHIVLDNPAFTTLPLLGPGAVGFQRHHHHPAGITIHNILNFVQEHLAGMCGVLMAGLVPARWSAGANTNLLRLFLLEVIVLSCFMMASHRWSHTQADQLSPLIVTLQEKGVLLSHLDHSLHHVDYNCNFAIFTGWCNPLLNRLTANVLHERRTAWLYLLALWGVTPLIVARLFFYRRLRESHTGAASDVELATLKEAMVE